MGAVIGLIVAVVLMLLGVPIAFAFAAMVVVLSTIYNIDLPVMMTTAFWQLNSLILVALPLFILLGYLMQRGGAAQVLIDCAESITGRIKGGLGATMVVTCGVFGAISGSCTAALSALGTLMLPGMFDRGYPRGFSASLLSISCLLGILIPPSITMILFAFVCNLSVAACFLSTVGPGILLIIINVIINTIVCSKVPTIRMQPPIGFVPQVRKVGRSMRHGAFALFLPIFLLGGIYGGVFTPTEAAAMAVAYAILLGFLVYRGLSLRSFIGTLVESATTTGVIIVVVIFSLTAGRIFTSEQIPQQLTNLALGISDNRYVVLLMANVLLIVAGMVMDDITCTVVVAPMLLPMMIEIGVSPIHFAAIVGTSVVIGANSPPVAPILYLASRISKVGIEEMMKPALMLIAFSALPVMLVTTYWSDLSLFLPRLAGYIQ